MGDQVGVYDRVKQEGVDTVVHVGIHVIVGPSLRLKSVTLDRDSLDIERKTTKRKCEFINAASNSLRCFPY